MSRSMEPRWGEIFLHHLKETEEYLDRRRKLGNNTTTPSDPQTETPLGKGRAKAKAQGEAEAGPGPTA